MDAQTEGGTKETLGLSIDFQLLYRTKVNKLLSYQVVEGDNG
jgi:hypothetical protein